MTSGCENHARRGSEGMSLEDELIFDGRALVAQAQMLYEREEVTADEALDLRAGRRDDSLNVLRTMINVLVGDAEIPEFGENPLKLTEDIERRISVFAEQYTRMSIKSKARCTWDTVTQRLLAREGRFLSLAEGLSLPTLFGVDKDGNPLFANGDKHPLLAGMNYDNARKNVKFMHKYGLLVSKRGVPIPTGYELFPSDPEYKITPEISMFQDFTEMPFSTSEGHLRSSIWLESGEYNDKDRYKYPLVATTRREDGRPNVFFIAGSAGLEGSLHKGVRYLLRLTK